MAETPIARLLTGNQIIEKPDENELSSLILKVGETAFFDVAEIPSSGYQWTVDEEDDIVSVTRGNNLPGASWVQKQPEQPPKPHGYGETVAQEFIMKALKAGTGKVAVSKRRPWEDPDIVEPIDHVAFTVNVVD
jgi:predicted secreted protein